MFKFFSKEQKTLDEALGLYMSGNDLFWARVIRSGDTMRVSGHGIIHIPQQLIKSGLIIDAPELSHSLRSLRIYNNIPVVYTVPLADTIAFTLDIRNPLGNSLDQLVKDQANEVSKSINVAEHIQAELSSHIAHTTKLSLHDVVCEYEILHSTDSHFYISAVVYPRSCVEPSLQALAKVGFKQLESTTMPYNLMRMHHDENHAYLLVVIEENSTSVALVDKHTLITTKQVSVGEDALIKTIQSFLNIKYDEARKIFDRYGLLPVHREPKLLEDLVIGFTPITAELQSLYTQWHDYKYSGTTKSGNRITDIVVAGTGAYIPGVLEHLETLLHLPTRHVDVWRLFPDVEQVIPEINWHEALRFAPAIAVAVEKIRS